MPNTFADVKARAERDPAFLGQLVVNPKKALKDAKINLTDSRDVNRIELFVKAAQEQLKATGKLVGLKVNTASWGIGCSCCNTRLLMPGSTPVRGGRG